MASNNNPPGYTPPALPDTSTMVVPSPTQSSSVSPSMETATGYFCEISAKCQSENKSDTSRWLYCKQYNYDIALYFSCACKHTNSLSQNDFFSASCVLQECNGADARKQFLAMYRAACLQRGTSLKDVPPDWDPYDQPLPTESTVTVSSQLLTTTQPLVTTQPSTSTQVTSATSSSVSSDISATQSPKTTSNTESSAMPTPTGPADGQIPICGISDKCMTKKPQGEFSCSTGDLDCICKVSNSLEKNTEFDQQCVLDDCYGDIGREEFLDSLFYHCKKVNKELVDIPKRWEPYLPANFPSATPAADPSVDSNDNVGNARSPFKLSGGAIGGIVAAAVVVVLVVLGLMKLWWDSRKKANTLKKDNAMLQDATNPEGISMRINTLMSDSATPEFASHRNTTSAGRDAEASTYGPSAYNDATLIGSPRSMDIHPVHGYGAAPRDYGANTEDFTMSEYGEDKYTGHGRQYSREHSRYELPDNERRDFQTAPNQENSDDESMSRYSARRHSYGEETVDLQRQRGQEARSDWGAAQSREWTRENEEDCIRRSARY